jgi:hypothetical protein
MRCLSVCLLLCAIGCSQASKAENIALDEIPDNVMTVAREKLPEVKFEQAIKKKDGIYEISGKDGQGKIREIEVSPSGEIVEIE